MSVAIVSSIYGDYDDVSNAFVSQREDAEFILVTDKPTKAIGWRVEIEPRPGMPPRLASRVAKCNPWLYTDSDVVIWVDGDIEITSPWFVTWCLQSLGEADLCQARIDRTASEEVEASFRLGKWDSDPLNEMLAHYTVNGYPDDYGIWWCGMMIRRKQGPDFGSRWYDEMVRWSCQDQIPYSYILHEMGIKPKEMAIHYHDPMAYTADYFKVHRHPDCSK